MTALFLSNTLAQAAETSDAYDDEDSQDEELGEEQDIDPKTKKPLSAGGLEAPDSIPEAKDQRTEIEKELDDADRKDAGRGLEFAWLEAQVGYHFVSLGAFRNDEFLPEANLKKGSGLALSGAGGIRLLYFSLGARFRYTPLADFAFYTLGPELAWRIPVGSWEPYALLGVGYAHVGGAKTNDGERIKGVAGLFARAAAGVDYYFSQTFSVGAQFAFDYTGLRRSQQVDLCVGTPCAYAQVGRASGYALTSSLGLGLHF
jgi:hypothetical protein